MDTEIELISDGDGLAVVGHRQAVESFLDSVGILSLATDLGMDRMESVLGIGGAVLQGASEIAANSCLYLKVDRETAQLIRRYGLMETKTPGISYAMLGKPGAVSKWVKVENRPQALLTNPAVLSGIAGVMAQISTERTTAEIVNYLAIIDEKVEDLLQKQDDAMVAQMFGTAQVLDRAMKIREETGEVNATLWLTVANAHQTIGATQKYALDQLDSLAAKLERTKVGSLAGAIGRAESEVPKWLGVLAHCFKLQDATDEIELDRALAEASAGSIFYHLGLKEARNGRRELIAGHTANLLERIETAVMTANEKMVWNRAKSMDVVTSANRLASGVHQFHEALKIESDARSWDERQLGPSADMGSRVLQTTKDAAPIAATTVALLVGFLGLAGKVQEEEKTKEG